MNAMRKITVEMDIQEFSLLDVILTGEIAQALEADRRQRVREASHWLESLRRLRARLDSVRPPPYAAAIRAADTRPTVCET